MDGVRAVAAGVLCPSARRQPSLVSCDRPCLQATGCCSTLRSERQYAAFLSFGPNRQSRRLPTLIRPTELSGYLVRSTVSPPSEAIRLIETKARLCGSDSLSALKTKISAISIHGSPEVYTTSSFACFVFSVLGCISDSVIPKC